METLMQDPPDPPSTSMKIRPCTHYGDPFREQRFSGG